MFQVHCSSYTCIRIKKYLVLCPSNISDSYFQMIKFGVSLCIVFPLKIELLIRNGNYFYKNNKLS